MPLIDPETFQPRPDYPQHLELTETVPAISYREYRMEAAYTLGVLMTTERLGNRDLALRWQARIGRMATAYPEHHLKYTAETFGHQM